MNSSGHGGDGTVGLLKEFYLPIPPSPTQSPALLESNPHASPSDRVKEMFFFFACDADQVGFFLLAIFLCLLPC